MTSPMSLAEQRASLRWGASVEGTSPGWLVAAQKDPKAYWEENAGRLVGAAAGAPRSAVFDWYDLFHEFGARHISGSRPGYSDYNSGTGFQPQSYKSLVAKARALAFRWKGEGLGPGTSLCICLAPSPAYLSCLLAAWCCGAAVSILPPDGRSFVVHRLLQLVGAVAESEEGPEEGEVGVFVVAGSQATPWVSGLAGVKMLGWDKTDSALGDASASSHRFPAGAVAARFWAELGGAGDRPVALSAEQLYLGALRDGVLIFGLKPGASLAAPGFCDLQYKPALILACLATGAHYIEFDHEELGDGSILLGSEIDVLGITSGVRSLLLPRAQTFKRSRLRRWFRNLAEDSNVKAWTALGKSFESFHALGMNWFANSAAGGSILFSPWCQQPASTGVWRSPGLPCERTELNGTTMPAMADAALLVPDAALVGEPGVGLGLTLPGLGRPVLSAVAGAEIWVANLGSHRRGKVLPELEMEAVLSRAFPSRVRVTVLVSLPTHGGVGYNEVALLVYLWPHLEGAVEGSLIASILAEELGASRVPDKIEVLELNPMLVDPEEEEPEIDRRACAAQYISGTLWEKARLPVFRELALLAKEMAQFRSYQAVE